MTTRAWLVVFLCGGLASAAAAQAPTSPGVPPVPMGKKIPRLKPPPPPLVPVTPKSKVAPAPTPPAVPPPPELKAQFGAFAGRYRCTGNVEASPFGAAHPVEGELWYKPDLDGHAYVGRYQERKTKDNPQPYIMQVIVRFDANKKLLDRVDVDNLSGFTRTSGVMDGASLVWRGQLDNNGAAVEERWAFVDKRLDIALALTPTGGTSAPLMHLSCTRALAAAPLP